MRAVGPVRVRQTGKGSGQGIGASEGSGLRDSGLVLRAQGFAVAENVEGSVTTECPVSLYRALHRHATVHALFPRARWASSLHFEETTGPPQRTVSCLIALTSRQQPLLCQGSRVNLLQRSRRIMARGVRHQMGVLLYLSFVHLDHIMQYPLRHAQAVIPARGLSIRFRKTRHVPGYMACRSLRQPLVGAIND